MVWLFIVIILCMRVVQSIGSKKNSSLLPKNALGFLKYVSFYMFLAACLASVMFIINLCINKPQELYFSQTLLYAAIAGTSLSLGCLSSLYNLTQGTMSLNALFGTAGLLIPTIASVFLYGETPKAWHWFAIAVFMVGAFLLIGGSKAIYGKFSFKNLLFLTLLLICEGTTMLMQKMFGMNVPDGNVSLFSVLSFACGACILSLSMSILYLMYTLRKKEKVTVTSAQKFTMLPTTPKDLKLDKRVFFFALVLAVAVFIINQLATMSTPFIAAVVLFAFINGGATIISTLVGAIFFKEKISARSALGLVLGIGALILLQI